MAVDVLSEITIDRPRDELSAFAADPINATAWYKREMEPGRRFVMATAQETPFPMETTYTWEDVAAGGRR